MQYFCGIKEFSRDLPFAPSLMVTFRKRFSDDILREINEMLFSPKPAAGNDDADNDRPNSGTLIMDISTVLCGITINYRQSRKRSLVRYKSCTNSKNI